MPIERDGEASTPAPRRPRTPSCSACWPDGSACRATSLLAGLRKRFAKKGAEVLEGNERAFAAGVAFAAGASAARRSRGSSRRTSPHGATAAGRRQRHVRGRGDLRRLRRSSAATRSRRRPRSCSSSAARSGSTAARCCRPRTRSPASAPCVGASFAGKKAMTATSGPGMSLKTEMLGLATIAELPLVCVNVQRGGPSTGIPTKSEQSDLFQAAFSAHGDVVAPGARADRAWPTRSAIDGRGVQHRRAVPDAGHHPVRRRRSRSARRSSIRSTPSALHDRRAPQAERARARALRALPDHRVGRQPDQPPGHGRAATTWRRASSTTRRGAPTASGEMHARMNEKRHPQADAAQVARATCSRSRATADAPIALVSWGSVAGVALEAPRWRGARASGSSCSCRGCSIRSPRRSTATSSRRCRRASSSSSRTRVSSIASSGCSWTCRAGSSRSRAAASNPIRPTRSLERLRDDRRSTLQRQRVPKSSRRTEAR